MHDSALCPLLLLFLPALQFSSKNIQKQASNREFDWSQNGLCCSNGPRRSDSITPRSVASRHNHLFRLLIDTYRLFSRFTVACILSLTTLARPSAWTSGTSRTMCPLVRTCMYTLLAFARYRWQFGACFVNVSSFFRLSFSRLQFPLVFVFRFRLTVFVYLIQACVFRCRLISVDIQSVQSRCFLLIFVLHPIDWSRVFASEQDWLLRRIWIVEFLPLSTIDCFVVYA